MDFATARRLLFDAKIVGELHQIPSSQEQYPIMLITGFEGYGGRGINPAGEIAKSLDSETIAGVTVKAAVLPVSYAELAPRLSALIDEHKPTGVICLGLWPGEPMIRLERFGVNKNDFEIPDNVGTLQHGEIEAGGPTARTASLPLEVIQTQLLAKGIPARLSSTAGNFLCNALLYTALGLLERKGLKIPCGFIHIPYLPEQVAEIIQTTKAEQQLELHQRGDLSSMPLETCVAAIRTAIEVTLRGPS